MDLYGLSGTAYPLMEGNYAGRSTLRLVTLHNTNLNHRNIVSLVPQTAAPVRLGLFVPAKDGSVCLVHGSLPCNSICLPLAVQEKAIAVKPLEANGLERQFRKRPGC